ncbi:MAG: translation initiation factor IF-3 [candidate division Zixibacteria bacterium]|nr:translation initiation factor IF-3 [candidate division Zixibacteria bacterium]
MRVNRRIRIPQVRVIGSDGEQLGILDTREALQMAQNEGLDLVEISPNARPPVCRILDFGKYQYEEAKNQKKAKKRQQSTQMKEMRYRPKIDEHDIQFKTNRLREFLQDGHKVRAYVEFRGREMTHTEFGYQILERIKEMLSDVGQPESSVRMEGRRMSLIIDPKKGAGKQKKEQPKQQEKESKKKAESSGDDSKPADEQPDQQQQPKAEKPEEVAANQSNKS